MAKRGRPTGRRTPDLVFVDTAAPHSLLLRLDGFQPSAVRLELRPGEVRELHLDLDLLPSAD